MEEDLTSRPAQAASRERVGPHRPRIFINYRRDDSAGDAGRLYDALVARFGKGAVFMDVDAIPPGADFAEVINQAVGSCEVLVIVIGKNWLSLADARGARRLDDQRDIVRIEIQVALEHKIRLVPVLVQGAQMPRADELPDSLIQLAGRNAFEISHGRWQYDVGQLITAIDRPSLQIETPLHNLPRQLTSFVGRGDDVNAVKVSLDKVRLLTLTGTGGLGKTRLAIQAANELVPEFRDGVWLVELAPIAAADLVPKAIAVELGVPEQSGRDIAETLAEYLRPRHVLLVLDNCEHLVEAVASVVEALLRSCPDLRVLVTSREALGIGGEEVRRLRSLSVPESASHVPAEDIAQFEAVALFCDRATTAVGSITLTDRSAQLVAQLCQRLDGIPLAIELAAARLKVLSLEQIVLRLDDRFRLLTGGSRTALPRQQTLRATIDWSFELLAEAERTVLRRLSVFSGGASLEAAEVVCAGDPVDIAHVLDLLTELISKSMVLVGDSAGEARFGLLETIRQYGQERLIGAGEADDVRRRHRDWFLSVAERAEHELHGPQQLKWSELLELELGNLRAAFEWSMQADDTEAGVRLAIALGRFWYSRGHLSEGEDWLKRTLARGDGPMGLRAQAFAWTAQLASYLGDDERAKRLGEESLDLFRQTSDQRGVGFALRMLGLVAVRQDQYERATALEEESLAALRAVGDKSGIAESLLYLGQAKYASGDYESAAARFAEALALFRELGDLRFIAQSIGLLGRVALSQGNYAQAAARLEESLALLRELKDQGTFTLLLVLGMVERCLGNFELAKAALEDSLSACRKFGLPYRAAYSLCQLGIVAQLEGDLVQADDLLQQSLSLGRDEYALSRCIEALAGLACRQVNPRRGAVLFGAAQRIRKEISAPIDPFDMNDHEALVAGAKSILGEAEFRNGWLEGQAMTREEAIAFASNPASRARLAEQKASTAPSA